MKFTVYFAADHAGFQMKEELSRFVKTLGHSVVDCGAVELDKTDDYPDVVHAAAKAVAMNPDERRAIILGASGQGEAMVANRYRGVRAAVFYGEPNSAQIDESGKELDIISSVRAHNNTNVLSLGARFMTIEEAKTAVENWLTTKFSGEERHMRRNNKIDNPNG